MRISSIHLTNFRQHLDTHIDFDGGLTGIIGANGTGKSTILEAIAWALYGNTAARGNRDTIRSLRAPARAQVKIELEFELGGHHFRVVRGLTSAELFLDRAGAPIANSLTMVTDVLRRRIGMTRDEFFNTYFTGQKELSVMAAMGPTERAQFLSKLLGYERLRVAQDLARERRRAIVAEITGVTAGMPDATTVRSAADSARVVLAAAEHKAAATTSERAAAHAKVLELTPQWEAIQVERARIQAVDSDLRVAESDHAARQRELERHDRELADLATSQAELAMLYEGMLPLAAVREDLAAMDRLASEEGRRQTLVARDAELAAELARLVERRAQIESAPRLEQAAVLELQRRRSELEDAEKAHDAARTEWVRDKQEADTRIDQLKVSLAEYKKQRELLVNEGENGTCPICSRPLGDHYRSVLDMIDDKIESITDEGRYFRTRVDQLAVAPPDVVQKDEGRHAAIDIVAKLEKKMSRIQLAVQELAGADASIADREAKRVDLLEKLTAIAVGYSPEVHFDLKRRADQLQVLESRAAKLLGALEREAQLHIDRERATAALAIIRLRIADLQSQRTRASEIEANFAIVRLAFDASSTRLRVAELEAATALARLTSAMAAMEVASRAVADLERAIVRLDELNQERRLHEELDRAYTDLRTDLNLQLRPEISERASGLLTELTDGRYTELELDEGYDIIILEDGLPKSVISGGEEDLANLVLRLAISQMIAERAGQPLSLLILDEVFGSLDESRRHNVVDLLRRLHDRFEQVIVITHIESVRDGLDRVIGVSYDEESGASRVSQEPVDQLLDSEELEMGAA